MSKDPLKNWQLEEGGEPLDQWKLQDTEQEISSHMQLQQTGSTPTDWQPVEYRRAPGKSGRNWILPSIVIVALLVALAYVGYVSIGRLGLGDFSLGPIGASPGAPSPEPTPSGEEAAVAVVTDTPTVEATPTSEPPTEVPTATPEPSPTPMMITVRMGTVNEAAGVNARSEPSTDSDIIRLLNNGERVTVVRSEGDWLEVILSDNRAAWVSAAFIDQAVGDQVTVEQWNAILAAAGLPPIAAGGENIDATPGEQATPEVAALPVNVTVTADPGATVRLEPATEAQIVGDALLDTVLVATGRTAAGDWLLVTLPDGKQGWILANLVAADGDLTALAIRPATALTTPEAVATSEPLSPTTPVAGSPIVLEVSPVIPLAPYTNTVPTSGQAIAVSDTVGVNPRTAPTLTAAVLSVVPNGAVLSAVGRSSDNQWVQVVLPDNQQAWIFRDAVNVSSNIDDAPIVGAEGDIATPAEPTTTTGEATATITSLLNSNVRPAPDPDTEPLETASRGATYPAIGRTADSEWIQVRLANGAPGWILASTAEVNVDLATLPVAP